MTAPDDPDNPQGTPPPGGYGPPPPGYGPPPPGYGAPQGASSNTPLVLGIIGIVMAVCCWPIGLTLGIISYTQAKKQPGANTTVGAVAIGLSAVLGIVSLVMAATGHGFVYYRNN
jgi:hypothetical protein